MAYMQGFIIPVRSSNKAAYQKLAEEAAPIFTDHGAQRIVECWGDNVPKGETTDMYRAVAAEDGEQIVFSWIDWVSKEACDTAHEKMMSDERMQDPPDEMPFDGMRMIYTGFESLGENGKGGRVGYVQGYVAPVPQENRTAFAEMCATMREIAIDCGALHAADGLAGEIEDGKVTDFKRAVKAEAGEAIALGYVEWPSKAAFEDGSTKMRADSRMPAPGSDMPLDGKRLIFGGFEVMLDTAEQEQ